MRGGVDSRGLLVDTDVLIDFLRGRPGAVRFLHGLDRPPAVSVVTLAELWAGIATAEEEDVLAGLISTMQVVAVDAAIARDAGRLKRRHLASVGVGLPDALIAATARRKDLTLVTYNRKHFPMLEDVLVPDRE